MVAGWLTFLSQVSSNGNAPYEGTSVEEASGMLVPLLIMGARANELWQTTFLLRPVRFPREVPSRA